MSDQNRVRTERPKTAGSCLLASARCRRGTRESRAGTLIRIGGKGNWRKLRKAPTFAENADNIGFNFWMQSVDFRRILTHRRCVCLGQSGDGELRPADR